MSVFAEHTLFGSVGTIMWVTSDLKNIPIYKTYPNTVVPSYKVFQGTRTYNLLKQEYVLKGSLKIVIELGPL